MALTIRPEAEKMLILNNDDVRAVLSMETTIDALKQSDQEIADGEGICRPRIDLRLSGTGAIPAVAIIN